MDIELGYRPCVGVVLANREGKVFVGKRLDHPETTDGQIYWQMPQGGVDPGEDLETAMWRELHEETGVTQDNSTLIARAGESLRYDLPDELIGKLWGGKYRGQEQVWYLLRFTGDDSEVDLETHQPAEFAEWKWLDPEQLPEVIVPFKRVLYRAILEEFRNLI
ncbi:RNA pyrophosphohydrolase [Altererythrobacter aurantiacus]|uniref:RNA pyrophosphohydrolase n=1 Tax=Parapontixanthobacter aurantiacus TaxID=1463599 RepID=A0A844ZIA9_9SPHN|nr:RNA pyrophosphohydrolase [Parapontixanthobacter aurantiacus]MXO85449.1 RNA pyrophosphohydrolase [Parapontixanthobacter aurantiacus]